MLKLVTTGDTSMITRLFGSCMFASVFLFLLLMPMQSHAKVRYTIALADLSQLSHEELQLLSAPEHEVHLAEIAFERAKVDLASAELQLSSNKRRLKAFKADIQAAKAERKAANLHGDPDRTLRAEGAMDKGRRQVSAQKAERKYNRRLIKAERSHVDTRLVELHFRQAQLEAARFQALKTGQCQSVESYDEGKFIAQSDSIKSDWNSAIAAEKEKRMKATEQSKRWKEAVRLVEETDQ